MVVPKKGMQVHFIDTKEKLISENRCDVVIVFLCDVIIEGCCEDKLFYDNFSRILESRFKDEE